MNINQAGEIFTHGMAQDIRARTLTSDHKAHHSRRLSFLDHPDL